jgi:hypothetical protein
VNACGFSVEITIIVYTTSQKQALQKFIIIDEKTLIVIAPMDKSNIRVAVRETL